MITDIDIKKLKKYFATREDLKKFATKEDLEKFATKIDLAKLQIEMNERFESIGERMATKDDFRNAMTVLDKVLKEVLAMRQEQSFHVGAHDEINRRLDAIEKVPVVT